MDSPSIFSTRDSRIPYARNLDLRTAETEVLLTLSGEKGTTLRTKTNKRSKKENPYIRPPFWVIESEQIKQFRPNSRGSRHPLRRLASGMKL
jgi:hypothetical protein